jgi:hypothetical protein
MSDPSLPLQAALVARLKALGTAAGPRFYSVVPASYQYPYGVVWPGFATPIDEECWDRTESTVQVDIWADTPTYLKTKEIAGAIRMALHEQTLSVPGHVVDRIRVENITYTDAPPLYQARVVLSIETQPV